jgi:hypothetical protein
MDGLPLISRARSNVLLDVVADPVLIEVTLQKIQRLAYAPVSYIRAIVMQPYQLLYKRLLPRNVYTMTATQESTILS